MPRFLYYLRDRFGGRRSGVVDAAGAEQAGRAIARSGAEMLGLAEARVQRWQVLFDRTEAAPSEAGAEAAALLVRADAAGLPTGPLLQALAEEAPDRGTARTFRRLAEAAIRGDDLHQALQATATSLPAPVRALLEDPQSAIRAPAALDELAQIERESGRLRQAIASAALYPLLVLGLSITVRSLLAWGLMAGVAATMRELEFPAYGLFGDMRSYERMNYFGVTAAIWVPAVAIVIFRWRRSRVAGAVLNVVPLIGSSLRYGCAADAARTMAVLIEAGRTPAEALRLAASQCDYAVTAAGWSAAARAAERGREPALALVGRRGVPPSLAGALAQAPAPSWPAVLRTMADVYAAKGRHRAGLARMILGPMILVVAVGVVLWSYMELQLGLGMLINRLTM